MSDPIHSVLSSISDSGGCVGFQPKAQSRDARHLELSPKSSPHVDEASLHPRHQVDLLHVLNQALLLQYFNKLRHNVPKHNLVCLNIIHALCAEEAFALSGCSICSSMRIIAADRSFTWTPATHFFPPNSEPSSVFHNGVLEPG